MTKRTRTAVLALAALAALALAAAATAAYTTPKLQVTYGTGNVTRIVASSSANDDSTARAAIVIPNGTTHHDDRCARHEGRHGAGPGERPRARRRAPAARRATSSSPRPARSLRRRRQQCTLGATPQLTLLLVLQAAGQTINLPAYVIPTSGAADGARLGPARVLPPAPGHPRGAGRRDVRREVPERRPIAHRRVRRRPAGRVGRVLDAVAGGQRPDQPGRHRRLAGDDRAGRPDA